MELRSVLVSYSLGPDSTNLFSSSGILLNKNCLMAHGSLLEPLMSKNSAITDLVNNLKGEKKITDVRGRINFQISVDASHSSSPFSGCPGKMLPSGDCKEAGKNSQRTRIGKLTAVWKCKLVTETLDGLLSNWTFSQGSQKENFAGLSRHLIPLFLLFSVEDEDQRSGEGDPLFDTVLRNLARTLTIPRRGEDVVIESTPFGNPVFMNSVANGVVGNVVGSGGSILLTDANSVLGCEGGPIFIKSQGGRRLPCGMVIAPLCWCRGEWVGYTLGVNLLPCLRNILSPEENDNSFPCSSSDSDIIGLLDRSVVVVRCGSGWGSGILVDRDSGTILTCSHVVKEAPGSRIKIHSQSVSVWGDLIYRTPNNEPYDVALVKVNPEEVSSLKSMSIVNAPVLKGDRVFSAGFPLFSSVDQPSILPTVTKGNVSHVSSCMLQTTCCIQSGASGGAIVNPSGELLGMVVCNASSSGGNALFPHLNMSVPSTVLKGPIEDYIKHKDVRSLRTLQSSEELIRQMWNLSLVPSKL